MTTLTDFESAVDALSSEQKRLRHRFVEAQLQTDSGLVASPRSVLDIAPVHLGPVLLPFTSPIYPEGISAHRRW